MIFFASGRTRKTHKLVRMYARFVRFLMFFSLQTCFCIDYSLDNHVSPISHLCGLVPGFVYHDSVENRGNEIRKNRTGLPILTWVMSIVLTLAVSGNANCQIGDQQANDAAKIPGRTLRELQNDVIPALEAGDYRSASVLLADMLNRSSPPVVDSINKLLLNVETGTGPVFFLGCDICLSRTISLKSPCLFRHYFQISRSSMR